MVKLDISGQVFGRLTAIKIDHVVISKTSKSRKTMWLCKCECGKELTVYLGHLKSGHSLSCGCYKKEKFIERSSTHGLSKTREYAIWNMMKARCQNNKNEAYSNYGGRGISVCPEWDLSFNSFIKDMGPCPSKKHSIERLNNNDGYSKDNCIWATKFQQDRNRRNNHLITFNGKTMIMTDWANQLGIDVSLFAHHIKTKSIPEIIQYYQNKKMA